MCGISLNKVSNSNINKNKIYDGPHIGILFGGNDNIIEENEIFDICKETNDVGAIYSGRDWPIEEI